VAVWSNVVSVGRINEVILRRARLVLRRVTVCGIYTVLLCDQPLRIIHPVRDGNRPRGRAV